MQSKQPAPEKDHFDVHAIGRIQKKDARTFIVMDKAYEPGLKGI